MSKKLNRLNRIVLRNCLKLSEPHAGSLSSSSSEFHPDRRTGDRKRPTAICVETTARYNEPVTVYTTQAKPRSDVGGRGEMVGDVPRCLTLKTAVHHDTHLVSNPLWHIKPIEAYRGLVEE